MDISLPDLDGIHPDNHMKKEQKFNRITKPKSKFIHH
jgi:hypothetical protein